jgi:hypothetical protein
MTAEVQNHTSAQRQKEGEFSLDYFLKRLHESEFWHRRSAEALCRANIGLLFECLSAHQEVIAARRLSLKGKRSIVAQYIELLESCWAMLTTVMTSRTTGRQFKDMGIAEARTATFEAGSHIHGYFVPGVSAFKGPLGSVSVSGLHSYSVWDT